MASHKPPHHRQGYHPLSSKLSADHEGWTEGIASLTEHNTATQLLDERPATNGRKVRGRRGQHVSGTQAGTRVRCRNGGGRAGRQPSAACGAARASSCPQAAAERGAEAPATPAVLPLSAGGGVCECEGMSPEEERRARLEHALRSLEVEVEQRGELLADLGGWGGWRWQVGVGGGGR